jgi:hypothetical protein
MKHKSQQAAYILDGYALEEDFARDNKLSKRTVAEYRKGRDGLPYTVWAGRIYIPIQRARDYLAARIRRPNPTRHRA